MKKSGAGIAHRRAAQGLRWLLASAVACLLATPAWAARVVDVRLGQHPGYSRLVFELDMPAGYKVERNSPAAGVNELVVSLDAGAEARTLRRKLDFIDTVTVEPASSRSATVRVRLKGKDLKLKEMILANPPRIVLDVLNEKALAAARAKAKAKPKAVAKAKPKAKPKAVAKAKPKPVAKAKPEPEPKTAARPKTLAGTVVKAKPEPKTEPKTVAKAPVPKPAARPAPPAPKAAEKPAPKPDMAKATPAPTKAKAAPIPQPPASLPDSGPGASPSKAPLQALAATRPSSPGEPKANRNTGPDAIAPPRPVPGATPTPLRPPQADATPAPRPAPTARPTDTPARPPKPKPGAMTPPSQDGLFSLTNIAVAGLGLLLLAGAAFLFIRRRNAAEVVDASAFENPLDEEDNPFADFDSEGVASASPAEASAGLDIPEPTSRKSASAASAAVQEGADMDMVSDNAQTTLMDSSGMSMGASGGGDVARMIQEFERRMKAMETRIDELVDAKERLERQVAAQTEELRVQRAAIARTQRAVRNLSRPGEDAPTEPALRDPARPEGPRQ